MTGKKIPKIFNPDLYLHRSERFSILSQWFEQAEVSRSTSIREYVLNSPVIKTNMPIDEKSKFHKELESSEIPYLLFLESQAFLNRAVCNFCAQLALHREGYLSWAIITTYYSSLYALLGLIRLQGKARISTHDLPDLPRGFFLSISSTTAPRCVVFKNWRNYHEQTCEDFYFAYRQFDLFRNSFEDFFSLKRDDLLEEVRRRNLYNYGLETGYKELDSPDYEREDLRKISARKVQLLPHLITEPDPELAFMARACCRIILLATTSWRIAKQSIILKHVFTKFLKDRERFIKKAYGINTQIGEYLIRFSRGQMRLN